jgi:hypothetical protein
MRNQRRHRRRRVLVPAVALLLILPIAFIQMKTPSNERHWPPEQAVTPVAAFDGERVTIDGVRNFRYAGDGTPTRETYETRSYDLSTLREVWYGISHFGGLGLAHTFLSFGFANGEYLVLSIEARREIGESYKPFAGLWNNYELIYVLADERDVIGLRSHVRKERVLLYKLIGTQETGIRLLRTLLEKANALSQAPAFYNTLMDNCTNGIVRHAERLPAWRRYLDYRFLLPGFSDRVAYDYGVIDTDRPLSQLRREAEIDPAGIDLDAPDFSQAIRGMDAKT